MKVRVLRGIRRVYLPNGGRRLAKSFIKLDRMYGFYRCYCPQRSTWESSHVYCVEGTWQVYFRQRCRKCGQARNPYHVEELICSVCHTTECTCPCDQSRRHNDMKKNHREDLCVKCERGYPCVDNSNRKFYRRY